MRHVALVVLLGAVVGCKANRWRDRADKGAETAAIPRKLADADVTASPPGPGFDVDDKSGHPKADLILRLDAFPEPRPGGTNLPTCFPAFAAGDELGSIVCEGKDDTRAPLLAGMLTQECYTHPEVAKVPASAAIALVGCKRGLIRLDGYAPTLRVDVEARDVSSGTAAPNALP